MTAVTDAETMLRLLQASSCFQDGAVCHMLPCACAESLARARPAPAAEGWQVVPIELTPAIACALEMCGPPEAQTPGALEQLVKDYREVWSHVLAAAAPTPATQAGGEK